MLETLVEQAPGIGGNIIVVLMFLRFMNGWRSAIRENTKAVVAVKVHLENHK